MTSPPAPPERFDTEKPPKVRFTCDGPVVITLNFGRNPGAAQPFLDWFKLHAWSLFGDWYDGNARKYESGAAT